MSTSETSNDSADAAKSEPTVSSEPTPISTSSAGRVSGKPWKYQKTATVRSHIPDGVKTKSWSERMEKTQKEKAVKKLQIELKEERQAEFTRQVTPFLRYIV
ncbi:hypothetical protein PHLCEN_2v8819 [Hermanssonia centrifuga]|uniref:rRNA-processing protein n=1 Tax=Hermanssonia centrifuga TaxID=98765 RepID=A0A2R6NSK9_9APHY|nr:hypothetical protein PHLCEN_2v8819 [Hermanssonia centrifuga]